MRVLLSTYDSRGGVEPLLALAVQLPARGVQVRVCAPPDAEFAARAAGFGVAVVPVGDSVRELMTASGPQSETDLRRHLDELMAAQFDTVAGAAEGCDALVATGLPAIAAATRSVTDKLGIHYRYASYHPTHLPSPHHPPPEYAGGPFQSNEIENRVLWGLNARNVNVLFGAALNDHRAAIGLPPLDDVRDYAVTDHPWLAADPTLGPWQQPAGLDVVQTGAWVMPDERPLPAELVAFLDAGPPPVYVGFGSMAVCDSKELAGVATQAIRALGGRAVLAHGWAELAPIDDGDDCFAVGEVNQQALFRRVAATVHHGGAGTTTTAARAGVPQVVIPQGKDQLYWAERVSELGIGTTLAGPIPDVESLTAAVATALTLSGTASAVAGAVRGDGAAIAAGLLVDAIS